MKGKKRIYQSFSWKNANYRICSPAFEIIVEEIKTQRHLLETYIIRHPQFKTALRPLQLIEIHPLIASQMADAAQKTGVGPMAGVAGAIAQAGVMAACTCEVDEAIVENGGDIYVYSEKNIIVGLYPGEGKLSRKLAFLITPDEMPCAICSSSSHMGHSESFGNCDLATVIAKNGALADAAATMACNSVKTRNDIETVLAKTIAIPGIRGVLIVKDDHVGMIGNLPEIVKNKDPDLKNKITHDQSWDL